MSQPYFKYCVLCLNEISQDDFSREHIIPSSIGGQIFSDEILCKKCNNDIGSAIDSKVFKHREIIELAEQFELIQDSSKYYGSAFNINIEAEGHELRGYIKKGIVYPTPQKVTEDHFIVPDEITKDTLGKLVNRDKRYNHLSEKEKTQAINNLLQRYVETDSGSIIESKELGIHLKKGLMGDKVTFVSKETSDPLVPVFIKIFYEWLSIIAYGSFFNSGRLFSGLRKYLATGNLENGLSVFRLNEYREAKTLHCVIIEFDTDSTTCLISLFSKVTYQIIAPPIDLGFIESHKKNYNLDSFCGVHIEDNFGTGHKGIWIIDEKGNRKRAHVSVN